MNAAYSTNPNTKPNTLLFATSATLVAVTVLAAIVSSAKRSVDLDAPLSLISWPVVFRPPLGWIPDARASDERAVFFQEPHSRGSARLLIVEMLPKNDHRTLEDLVKQRRIDLGYTGLELLLAAKYPFEMRDAPFAGRTGLQLEDGGRGLLISAGTVAGRTMCIVLKSGFGLTDRDRRLVNRVADSVEPLNR